MEPLLPQETVRYKTYLKRAMVEALRDTFGDHPDDILNDTRVSIDFPTTEADYPSIIVRYNGQSVSPAGVGHQEWLIGVPLSLTGWVTLTDSTDVLLPEAGDPWPPTATASDVVVSGYASSDFVYNANTGLIRRSVGSTIPSGTDVEITYTLTQPDSATLFNHSIYKGTVEFSIYALSSLDRDLLSDSIVQIVQMGGLEGWTNNFLNRIYSDSDDVPYSAWHFVNIDTDNLQESGETQQLAPWMAEDVLVYQSGYRVGVLGELYSLPPDAPYQLVGAVDLFPYIQDVEPRPDGSNDAAPWLSDGYFL